MARISGNDIASFQKDINYDVYKNNSNFVILKVSEGVGFLDPKAKRNQSEARRVGLPLGFYHFARPDIGNAPEKEAQWFLDQIGELMDGEVLALDYELNKTADQKPEHVDWCKKWLDYIFSKTACRPLIYMSESVVLKFDWKPLVDASYGLWIAKYLNNPTPDASYNTGKWSFAAMYQWTSKQHVPGVLDGTGNVDGDVFFGDVATFKKYGYKKPAPPENWEQKYNDLSKSFEDYKRRYNQEIQDNAVSTAIAALNARIDSAQNG